MVADSLQGQDGTGRMWRGRNCPVLVGPTAVGKTSLVVSLAARFPIEVISLDSRQIYRGMRIGTAQPTATERAACRHHLVDFLSPRERYSAAQFRRDFCDAYREICERKHIPILVGGAGLYLTAVREGLFALEEAEEQTLADLRAELGKLDDAEIRTRLEAADPESWRRIHANDRYRSQRALEIHLLTGRTMTRWMAEQTVRPALDLKYPTVYLNRPRQELNRRIEARTAGMLQSGWVEETRELIQEHGPEAPGLQSIGYREIISVWQNDGESAELADRINLATRQYAKRQQTWFRAVPKVGEGSPESGDIEKLCTDLVDAAGAPS